MRRMAIAAVLVALFAIPALAQNPPEGTPTRVRGVVDKLNEQTLTVKSREGEVLTIALAPDVAIQTLVKKTLTDIKPGDFVASTGIKAPEGMVLHVTFKGGESEYSVGPDVPVLANAPGDTSLLKPGAAVFVIALKNPDGSLTSSRIYAEKDGIKPPM
jgi:hypothetical protein